MLLNRIRLDAESLGFASVRIEASEERSLPALLAPALRTALLRLRRIDAAKEKLGRAMKALAGFIGALKLRYADVELALDVEPELGLADSGDLDTDLTDLLMAVGEAAAERGTAVVLFADELQYVPEAQLAALIMALHNVNQAQLPVTMVAAGLPQLLGSMGRAKSYAERLFEFVPLEGLSAAAADDALRVPVMREGVDFSEHAIRVVLEQSQGYPYFLQEWGKQAWNGLERLRSTRTMPASPPRKSWPIWTPASSASASTDSRLRRRPICAPWRSWAPDRTARVRSPSGSGAR